MREKVFLNECEMSVKPLRSLALHLDYMKHQMKLEILAQNIPIDISHSIRRVRSSEKNMMEPMSHTFTALTH